MEHVIDDQQPVIQTVISPRTEHPYELDMNARLKRIPEAA